MRLSEAPDDALRMSELADRTLFSRSRLSHAVGRLERTGLVRREPYPGDRRGLCAVLTGRACRALEPAAPGHVETVRRALFDALTPRADRAAHEDRASRHRGRGAAPPAAG